MRVVFIFFILAMADLANADGFDDHFAVVFIDKSTEAKYGPVPLDRGLLATAINELAKAGAKGVLLKFFLDQAKDDAGDQSLADAFTHLPVILQARIDINEPSPNLFPERFTLPFQTETSIAGNSGWIPRSRFSSVAYDIGFADYNGFPLPLLETYREQTVKSLLLCAIELAFGEKAVIQPQHQATVGGMKFALNSLNQVSVTLNNFPTQPYIPFHDVLETKNWVPHVKGKVVVLAYDGPAIHKIDTDLGDISAHRFFVRALVAMLQAGT